MSDAVSQDGLSVHRLDDRAATAWARRRMVHAAGGIYAIRLSREMNWWMKLVLIFIRVTGSLGLLPR